MMDFEGFYQEFESMLGSISWEYGAKGQRWGADHDDFRQEMTLWMLDNTGKMNARAADFEDPDRFKRWVAKSLRNTCIDHLAKIAGQAGANDKSYMYFYSVPELKVLLGYMFDPDAKINPPQYDTDERSKRDPAHGNNWLVTLADVEVGYNRLSYEDQNLLALFHRDGYRNKDLAAEWDLTEAQMSWRHTRAVERLLDHLGGPKPTKSKEGDPFKGRTAISNAGARLRTRAEYDGLGDGDGAVQ